MWNNCNGMMGAWGWLNAFFSILILALVIGGVIWLVRRLSGDTTSATTAAGGAEAILAERYARGEIDDQEYQQRLGVLRDHR